MNRLTTVRYGKKTIPVIGEITVRGRSYRLLEEIRLGGPAAVLGSRSTCGAPRRFPSNSVSAEGKGIAAALGGLAATVPGQPQPADDSRFRSARRQDLAGHQLGARS